VRRNRLFRILGSIMSIWLAICLAEPMQLHTCVMHGGLAIEIAGHAAHSGSTSHHTGALHHTLASGQSSDHSRHQQGDSHSRQCSCLGDCNTGRSSMGLAATRVQLGLPAVHSFTIAFAYASPSVAAPHFFLPFSNGPPAASSLA
jgi:hypothetical protein